MSSKIILPKDKQLHIGASAIIAGVVAVTLMYLYSYIILAIAGGYSVSMTVGVLKEYYDSKGHGTEDIGDVYADMIGAILGAVLGTILGGVVL